MKRCAGINIIAAVPDDLFCAGRRVFIAATWFAALILSTLQGVFDPIFLPKGTLRAPGVDPLEGQDGPVLSYLQVPVPPKAVGVGIELVRLIR